MNQAKSGPRDTICLRDRLIVCAFALASIAPAALAQQFAEALNMALVGFNDLQARSAYQPVIQNQNGRWIAYVGHHGGTPAVPKPVNPLTGQAEFNGTSIIDGTDPKAPQYLHHIPGEEGIEPGAAQGYASAPAKAPRKGRPAVLCSACGGSVSRRGR
jgi:hypothetical protein